MIQRVLNSKNFLAVLLAMVTGTLLYFKLPWPMTAALVPPTWNEYFLRLIALRDPWTYAGLKASYHVMLFTTPYIGYSFLFSALYIFTLQASSSRKAAAAATLSGCGNTKQIEFGSRGGSQSTPSDPRRETELAHHPGARIVHRHDHHWCCREREDQLLHVSVHGPIVGLSGSRSRREASWARA